MCKYLEQNNIICNEQFGFRKNRCTINAIDSLVKNVLQVFEQRGLAHVTFCDLSKAFDCVDHETLVHKLGLFGFQSSSLDILKSFLEDRKQIVCIGSDKSNVVDMKCGVPQGSVLGPLLFILMINDLPCFVNTHTVLYADDTTFVNNSYNFDQLKTMTEDTICKASKWFRANGFLLNESKTQSMFFSLKDLPHLGSSHTVKFLGIYLDDKLSWEPHIEYISGRLSRVIFLIKNLKSYVPYKYIRSAYFAFFQSIISYGILLWGNCSCVHNILLLQKKVVRVIAESHRLDHCKPLFVKLKVLTIINLYIYIQLFYIPLIICQICNLGEIYTHIIHVIKIILMYLSID